MFTLFLDILKKQSCHFLSNIRSYIKLFGPLVGLVIVLIWSLYFIPETMMKLLLSMPTTLMYLTIPVLSFFWLKLLVHSIRFVTLDEIPKCVYSLKYSKQTYLVISYYLLIGLYTLFIYLGLTLLLIKLSLMPALQQNANYLPDQTNAISANILNSLNNAGIQTSVSSTNSVSSYYEFVMYLVAFIVSSLMTFNVIAVASDIKVPFYRSMLKLKSFFMCNLLIYIFWTIISKSLLGVIGNLLLSMLQPSSSSLWLYLLLYTIYFLVLVGINVFFLMCLARSFRAWQEQVK